MKKCNPLDLLSAVLVFIGALSWGLVGVFHFNLIDFVFGSAANIATRIVYVLIGLFGIYHFITDLKGCCPHKCKKES